MEVEFSGEIYYWRGPSPFHFISVPPAECAVLKGEWSFASYGWGMIPVTATIGETSYTTSLFPKDGGYRVPIKDAVRDAEEIDDGDVVDIRLAIRLPK
jgi:hypothetical protein